MSIEADEAMIVIDALELSPTAAEAVIRQLTANLAEGETSVSDSSARWLHQPDGSVSIETDAEPILATFYCGEFDGRPVVQIDGAAAFRVNVNDSTIWDQSPEASDWVTIFSAAQSWLEELRAYVIPGGGACERGGHEVFAAELEGSLKKLG
ncbi:hypothetical protein [Arthrobacter glacialis]|uniref:Uncharacterized protein n=1 Tax=Arthrobacter glacialis TaxID=1664 RepID=A0A2S3ZT65_ARTGL|nr:hypothetical protein [Arthrobacter glacialis]POH72451.1 hypothetical protein CVS27_15050 [Arthrobacter glacialis]